MKKKDLEKRILELEKLISDKDFMIEFLQLQLDNQPPQYFPVVINECPIHSRTFGYKPNS